jgi:hypothetical protein
LGERDDVDEKPVCGGVRKGKGVIIRELFPRGPIMGENCIGLVLRNGLPICICTGDIIIENGVCCCCCCCCIIWAIAICWVWFWPMIELGKGKREAGI